MGISAEYRSKWDALTFESVATHVSCVSGRSCDIAVALQHIGVREVVVEEVEKLYGKLRAHENAMSSNIVADIEKHWHCWACVNEYGRRKVTL